ncbi:tryptophan halogenase [Dokdonella fugitiva]|uniref:Tryptophan halogenase n=1 Tax=Dokdonella fugitiva TaxID=328517 RepID=A0A839EQ77_9GAMM|nr:tryptophan halogenase family protein [Dokdonella fugitiva]MBA8886477.1 tryptophan halogenase [Dokdonella fugitiva]
MTDRSIRSIVIVGGGTAGWMTAAACSKILGRSVSIRVIESEEIRTVGVGEATVPHLKRFNNVLEFDEVDFVKRTQGTFKLGIQFENWARVGDSYVHGFGTIGHDYGLLPFHQYWLKLFLAGEAAEIGEYSLNTLASVRGKFMASASDMPPTSPLANIAYAYHFDAGLYALYLRKYAEARGVVRTEGKIVQTLLREPDGFVDAVVLESGEKVHGELFVDCSGFRGLLIEQALHTGYEDWSHWLPCDRAIAVSGEKVKPSTPYTRAIAHQAGWQWCIPLQHRTGDGHVYCSRYVSDDEATATLLQNLAGRPMNEPRVLKFVTGRRKKFWNRNVVAIGLSSGFLEPLESTSIYWIQSAIARLMNLFPDRDFSPAVIDRFNAQAGFEFERIRDFLILHYHATERNDTPFWDYCRTMSIPEALAENIRLFRDSGRFFREGEEMFAITSWVQVLLGQRILPKGHHPIVDTVPLDEIRKLVGAARQVVDNCVGAMPRHEDFIDRYCKAPPP